MSWVYILSLKNGKYYIGSTNNLQQRISDHTRGKSPYTKKFLPIKLEFSQEFPDISSAGKTEKYLKKLKSHKIIEKIIYLQTLNIFE
jgi:putative endonuclease